MTETLSTTRQDLAFSLESVLAETATGADKPRIWVVYPSATATFEQARDRVRSIELKRERQLADEFTKRVIELDFVKEVWAVWEPSLDLTVIVSDRNLDAELQLYVIFREVASRVADPSSGDLAVLPAPYSPEGAEQLYSA